MNLKLPILSLKKIYQFQSLKKIHVLEVKIGMQLGET